MIERQKFLKDDRASAIPVILFVLGLLVSGITYTVFFIMVAPSLYILIPASIFKTLIIYGFIWFLPMVILIVGIIALMISAQKKTTDPVVYVE